MISWKPYGFNEKPSLLRASPSTPHVSLYHFLPIAAAVITSTAPKNGDGGFNGGMHTDEEKREGGGATGLGRIAAESAIEIIDIAESRSSTDHSSGVGGHSTPREGQNDRRSSSSLYASGSLSELPEHKKEVDQSDLSMVASLQKLWPFLKPDLPRLAVGFVALVVSSAVNLSVPRIISSAIDRAARSKTNVASANAAAAAATAPPSSDASEDSPTLLWKVASKSLSGAVSAAKTLASVLPGSSSSSPSSSSARSSGASSAKTSPSHRDLQTTSGSNVSFILFALLVFAIGACGSFVRVSTLRSITDRLGNRLRLAVFAKIMKQDLAYFEHVLGGHTESAGGAAIDKAGVSQSRANVRRSERSVEARAGSSARSDGDDGSSLSPSSSSSPSPSSSSSPSPSSALQRSSHVLSMHLSSSVDTISRGITDVAAAGLRCTSSALGGTVMLFYLSPGLTMVSLSLLPFLGVAAMFYSKYSSKLNKQLQERYNEAAAFAQERFSHIETVRAFAQEPQEIDDFQRQLTSCQSLARRVAITQGKFMGGLGFCMNCSLLAVLFVGGKVMAAGRLTVGNVTSFAMYSGMVALGFSGLFRAYGDLKRTFAASHGLLEVLSLAPTVELDEGEDLAQVRGHMEMRSVSFAYPGRRGQKALRNVSLRLQPGRTVALVGKSGAGKSTVVKLLLRMYELDQGEIFIDGKNIENIKPLALRRKIGVVQQDPALFSGSILENIRYGMRHATTSEIMRAAKEANAHDFIMSLPNKYDTQVGENGRMLSGGQRQRIAIARAVLPCPPVLLFDEATSALDSENEQCIQKALEKVCRERAVLIIAHRLSTIQRADVVLVMEEGEIKETGTYQELVAQNGIFASLLKSSEIEVTSSGEGGGRGEGSNGGVEEEEVEEEGEVVWAGFTKRRRAVMQARDPTNSEGTKNGKNAHKLEDTQKLEDTASRHPRCVIPSERETKRSAMRGRLPARRRGGGASPSATSRSRRRTTARRKTTSTSLLRGSRGRAATTCSRSFFSRVDSISVMFVGRPSVFSLVYPAG